VLAGHSYGGPVVRNYASVYPDEVAGIVLVDAAHEGLRVQVGPKQTIRLGADVPQQPIPPPHEELQPSDKPTDLPSASPQPIPLEPMYKSLPLAQQKLHLWATNLPGVNAAEDSQRQWSDQSFARWLANPAGASLGQIPLIVLSRNNGGYTEDADVPASQMEKERKEAQDRLAKLSSDSLHIIVKSGHNMHLEAPGDVSAAIRQMVIPLRAGKTLAATP
jgi:pimeloyl-ACP methyl ester carboxylesterase